VLAAGAVPDQEPRRGRRVPGGLRRAQGPARGDPAGTRFDEFTDKWGPRYPAIVNLWRSAWEEFIVFLDYDIEIRKIICSTDEIVNRAAPTERVVLAEGCPP
jgi:Transposase, Mutator family